MQLQGFHHLTAITADIKANNQFFTDLLGMRRVKKTVNQDDVSAYHLFYADGRGSPGTDVTFFDWPMPRERRGTHAIVRTGLRVSSVDSLNYWDARLREQNVKSGGIVDRDGRRLIDFEDAEGQRLSLVVDEKAGAANAWNRSPVPAEHQVRGLGPITISVPRREPTEEVLLGLMGMRRTREYKSNTATDGNDATASPTRVYVYESGDNLGPAGELHVAVEPTLKPASQGSGAVHHVAFRIPTFEEYDQWAAKLREVRVPQSGPVDRFYFRSLYFREPNGILFELATDQPGFAADESAEHMGEGLALPPFLEPRRKEIEAGLKPL
jgi:glyoxalase family protein